jgi:Methyltransferase domain
MPPKEVSRMTSATPALNRPAGGLKRLVLSLPGGTALAALRTELLSRWFDWRNDVHTVGALHLAQLTIPSRNVAEGNWYYPTNLRTAVQMLEDLPIADRSRYTFIDFGSGKGRMLLMASHHPFRAVLGVEFAPELHAIAESNIRRYRNPARVCANVTSLNLDAGEFVFPDGDLVLYFFFPFRRPLMQQVMDRLDRALQEQPRDVLLVYMGNPDSGGVVDEMPRMRLLERRKHYDVYRSIVLSGSRS